VRLARDSSTVSAAARNTALTERAYTEGEMAISDVLEARRAQRDAETQYVNDLVAARVSDALIRVLTAPAPTP
jgi:outer membrane protein TolC